jgi:outer membrane protein assembly factor BamB
MASPVIDGSGHMYMQGQEGLTGDWCLWCVNTDDCSVNWQYTVGSAPSGTFLHSSCALSPVDGTIHFGCESVLYAINPDNTLKWTFGTGDAIESSPVVASDGTIYVGSCDNCLYAIDPGGTLDWTYGTGGDIYSSPAIASDGTIYVGCEWDQKLHAVNPDGTPKWDHTTGGAVLSSPAVGSDGTIYVGCTDGYLYAISSTGTFKWRYNTGNPVYSSPAVDDVRGVAFVVSTGGRVCAVHTAAGGEKWQTSMSSGTQYSSPVVASPNNMLYVGDDGGRFYVLHGETGSEICHNSHTWPITSPTIDEPDGSDYCVWYNEFCVRVRKVCYGGLAIESTCSCGQTRTSLHHHPNPFITNTTISFSLPVHCEILLQVHDVTGRVIGTVAKGDYGAGKHTVEWNAAGMQRGIYLCKLTAGNRTLLTKMVLME